MKTLKTLECRTAGIAAAVLVSLGLAGCAGSITSSTLPGSVSVYHFSGSVHGGQQPISGAAIGLYAASKAGYSGGTSNILTSTVTTDAQGSFDVGTTFSCTAGQQMYLTATGGNPGAGTNANAALLATLGDCANLGNIPFVSVNEVTTVGGVFALAPFMSSPTNVGTSSTNTAGLARAFASVNKLVNITNGSSTGSALPANATGPVLAVNTLANILAACINSTGGVASNTGTACGQLFNLTTPPAGAAPTNTIQAALNIAQNPTLNVGSLFNTAPPASPFLPMLINAPTDFALGIQYANVGLQTPKSATVDGTGQVWFANSGNNTLTVLAQTGTPIAGSPISGNSLSGPVAVAIDATGNAWVANNAGQSLSVFTPTGAASANYTGAGLLSGPTALAFDGSGNVFVVNSPGNSLVELNSAGSALGSTTTGIASPTAIAINPK